MHSDDKELIRDDLISDLEHSIEKALDGRINDLAGALFRLQGSVKGWCAEADCGKCALAPLMCINGMEERVTLLITQHHAAKTAPIVAGADSKKIPVQSKKVIRPASAGSTALTSNYFNHLNDRLCDPDTALAQSSTDLKSSGHKLNWRQVKDAFQKQLPTGPFDSAKKRAKTP
ncbi:MAG: hypothetical protein JKY34_07035 [Kordiimonadaceae bacterium]|nr:hypothetical protein [Kordiimonadaceae bacterium]